MNSTELKGLAGKEIERQENLDKRVYCCTSTACVSSGAQLTIDALQGAVDSNPESADKVEVVQTGCMGLCSQGPLVRIESNGDADLLYQEVDADVAEKIISTHTSAPVETAEGVELDLSRYILSEEDPFFTSQVRVVMGESGKIDPESIDDYLANDGYTALAKVMETMTPEEVCDEILQSGLRGRGGAGFPTGQKWKFGLQEESDRKYIVINGDEGDPGAYMDRTVMEAYPHRVLEGMLIAAYAIQAHHGYFYVRGEYPLAVDRLTKAIRAARRKGILGKSVMGTDFKFMAEVRIGAGAFVCGEETALILSIEGKRGTPRMRPPYPTTKGLWDSPTVINNVETMASVPAIINRGADWYKEIGSESSKGTKVFALTGQINNIGLIEVPMGITLREIVFDIGGGIPNGRKFKAAQTGGPSGGCIPEQFLDTPVDYESLKELGSMMGSGGLVVIDDTTSMPEFARFFMDFCVDESCGKCVPCRVGTAQIRTMLDKILAGEAVEEDLTKMEELCEMVKSTSLCGLGQSAPNPVLSTLKYFRHEYEELLVKPEVEEAHA
jgi:bidirectional [NiFe] hydrogenase diaphorase subunit